MTIDNGEKKIRHPATYSEQFLPIFAEKLRGCARVLDPFAGTGKIAKIKDYGFTGEVWANEIEKEWLEPNVFNADVCVFEDAEFLHCPNNFFDAICTSPTYGNRMADHHNAKDGSKRNTYTHCMGRELDTENTGRMQWGKAYQQKHERIYKHLVDMLRDNGLFVLNISNHIRQGQEIDVTSFHKDVLQKNGLTLIEQIAVPVKRLKFGANSDKRVSNEYILIFKKITF